MAAQRLQTGQDPTESLMSTDRRVLYCPCGPMKTLSSCLLAMSRPLDMNKTPWNFMKQFQEVRVRRLEMQRDRPQRSRSTWGTWLGC